MAQVAVFLSHFLVPKLWPSPLWLIVDTGGVQLQLMRTISSPWLSEQTQNNKIEGQCCDDAVILG